jgi:hypothetical protein
MGTIQDNRALWWRKARELLHTSALVLDPSRKRADLVYELWSVDSLRTRDKKGPGFASDTLVTPALIALCCRPCCAHVATREGQ